YSLGCTFCYLLTGQPPFPSATLAEKLVKHQQAQPPDVAKVRRDVPPELSAVIQKMLAKRPEDRYQTPGALAAALGPFCQEEPQAKSRRPSSGSSKHRRRLGAALGALVLILALGWLAVRSLSDKPMAPELTNSIGMKLVLIPAGKFMMGVPEKSNPLLAADDALPAHEVMITKPFYMGKYEVTQGQYEAVMGKNPSFFRGNPDLPVEHLTFQDAVEFCKKLSDREVALGRTYRLPTEAEWEYAYLAGSSTPSYFSSPKD